MQLTHWDTFILWEQRWSNLFPAPLPSGSAALPQHTGTCCTAGCRASRSGCRGTWRWSRLDSRTCSTAGRNLSSTANTHTKTQCYQWTDPPRTHMCLCGVADFIWRSVHSVSYKAGSRHCDCQTWSSSMSTAVIFSPLQKSASIIVFLPYYHKRLQYDDANINTYWFPCWRTEQLCNIILAQHFCFSDQLS